MTTPSSPAYSAAQNDRRLPVRPSAEALESAPQSGALFNDRDLSLLRFQQRVLEEARDPRTPLLDRVRFLGIVGTNLDDFIMVRGPRFRTDPARRAVVEAVVKRLFRDAHICWRRELVPSLRSAGVHLVRYAALTAVQRAEVDDHFRTFVAPHLSFAPWDDGTPCPPVPSLGLNLIVDVAASEGISRTFIVHLADTLPPFIPCGGPASAEGSSPHPAASRHVWVDQVVAANLATLLPRETVRGVYAFRVLRDADVPADVVSDLPTDPLECAIRVVKSRDSNPVVMLAVDRAVPVALLERLRVGLNVAPAAVYRVTHVPGLRRKWDVSRIGRSDLRRPDVQPRVPARVDGRTDLFSVLREGDLLLHHPFDSFQPVVDLVKQAARDPDVLGISMTLYRTDRESPIAHALLDAARHGKRVRVVVELTARFDEERNASWARRLSDGGVLVSFAPHGLKVHTKMALIERHEGTRVRRYAHISSGNYNAFTAAVYTDIALVTCDDDVSGDVAQLFDALTGGPTGLGFRRLVVAPLTLRSAVEALIEREMDWSRRGERGHIVMKMNALSDRDVISLLYRASQHGVQIDLLVRGICCLRPGVPGLSDTIRVRSVVGRFLEHSRIWYFRNGGGDDVFLGSADLMPRNLNRRVEVMTPVLDSSLKARVRDEILGSYMADNMKARELEADGSYRRVAPQRGERPFEAQRALLGESAQGRG